MPPAADRLEAGIRRSASWLRRELAEIRFPMLAALAVMLLGYGYAATQFQLAGDDWFAVFPANGLDEQYTLNSGRWMQYLFNIDGYAPGFTIPLAGIGFLLAGWLAARVWGWARGAPLFVTASLFAVNPVLTELLAFKQAHVMQALAAVAAVGAAALVVARPRRLDAATLIPAVLLLTIVYATYQPLAAITVVVWAGAETAHRIIHRDTSGRDLLGRAVRLGIAGVGSLALWAISVRLLWWATGTGSLRGTTYDLASGYVGPTTVLSHLGDVWAVIIKFWSRGSPFYPVAAKLAVIAAIVIMLAIALSAGRHRFGAVAVTAGAAAISLAGPFLASIPRDDITLRYSALAAAAATTALWAGAVTAAASTGRWPASTAGVAGVAGGALALLLAYGMTSSFTTFRIGHERDMAIANRMLARVDALVPADLDPVPIHIAGRLDYEVRAPFRDPTGSGAGNTIVNCRLFICQQFRLAEAFRLIDAVDRTFLPVGEVPAAADAVFTEMGSWPAPDSVVFTDGTVLIKLSE